MPVVDVPFIAETRTRYLTYALSVISGRALPDVRDGLKPVQRRILYAMLHSLHLHPDRAHRKSAAVVGEVLARFHPHGDLACYDAMVRMAQNFLQRYPLIDGQGNFGSLDGDAAAAYRYTEARLTKFALEVLGDIGEETVVERDNFDQTTKEPVVLPARVPNLLVNGATGIAVGMATAIPPHNLGEVIRALLLILEDEQVSDAKLLQQIKGPDFPTGCSVLNTRDELREIYRTGKGAIRMRADFVVEDLKRGRRQIVVTSVPYAIDKSALVEKIADLIIAKKVPQLTDVRDESTDQVRVVLELSTDADPETAMAYLFKHTTLQSSFHVNLTALVPTENPLAGKPLLLSLREMLTHFVDFRLEVTRAKLNFEKKCLAERIHLLEGLIRILDAIPEVIRIVRKSSSRLDAASRLASRFELSEIQSLFIVDLRIHQLSQTSIDEIQIELEEKQSRVREIDRILGSKKALKNYVAADLKRIGDEHSDKRRSEIVHDYTDPEFNEESYVTHEDAYVIVTKDGWLKRIGTGGDPQKTKIREGDRLLFAQAGSTRDLLALFTNYGNMFACRVSELAFTSGYGHPVQKMFRFDDGEQIMDCLLLRGGDQPIEGELFLYSFGGYGFRLNFQHITATKKVGKRLARLAGDDRLAGAFPVEKSKILALSEQGYGLLFPRDEAPVLSGAGKGVIIQRLPKGDRLIGAVSLEKGETVEITLQSGASRELGTSTLELSSRAKRGRKVVKRGGPVTRIINVSKLEK